MLKKIILFVMLISGFAFIACDSGPKVIAVKKENTDHPSTGIFDRKNKTSPPGTSDQMPAVNTEIHTIKVLEVLPTDKYVYMRAEEDGEEFWVATSKREVEVGGTYYFKKGLLKTNFESKEYNRIFEKVYLVSNIVSADHSSASMTETPPKEDPKSSSQNTSEPASSGPIEVEGSLSIQNLVENKGKFADQEVQVSGRVTKVNPNIMDRNWIHIKDGSLDEYDLVFTTQQPIPEGAIVTVKGIVKLDRDFGAGYRYDLIIEDATLVK